MVQENIRDDKFSARNIVYFTPEEELFRDCVPVVSALTKSLLSVRGWSTEQNFSTQSLEEEDEAHTPRPSGHGIMARAGPDLAGS